MWECGIFDPPTRQELVNLVGNRPELIKQLEREVFRYRPRTRVRVSKYEQLERVRDAAINLQIALDSLDEQLRARILERVFRSVEGSSTNLQVTLYLLRNEAGNQQVHTPAKARAGRPPNVAERELILRIGLILDDAGVSLTTGRNDVFSRVLRISLQAAQACPPTRLFRYVSEACKEVQRRKESQRAELRRHKDLEAMYLRARFGPDYQPVRKTPPGSSN
jgi:hypothetical protein